MRVPSILRGLGDLFLSAVAHRHDPNASADWMESAPTPPSGHAGAAPQPLGETVLARAERISMDRHKAIERFFKQSEGWKRAFYTQAAEHTEAQFELERRIAALTQALRRAVAVLDQERAAAGKEPIDVQTSLMADQAGVAQGYRDRMAAIGVTIDAEDASVSCPWTGQVLEPNEETCPVCKLVVRLSPSRVIEAHPPVHADAKS